MFENILEKIKEYHEKRPELRFCQLLFALGISEQEIIGEVSYIKDNFYDEDIDVYSRIMKAIVRNEKENPCG